MFVETEGDETTSMDESSNGNTSSATSGKNNPSSQLEQIIQRLPTCVNRDFIDDVSMTCAIKGFEFLCDVMNLHPIVFIMFIFIYSLPQTLS